MIVRLANKDLGVDVNNKALLKRAVDRIKSDYSAMSPEAVVCLIVALGNPGMTVGQISQIAGMTEPVGYRHIAELQRLDLVSLENDGTGANKVNLSEKGQAFADEVNSAVISG